MPGSLLAKRLILSGGYARDMTHQFKATATTKLSSAAGGRGGGEDQGSGTESTHRKQGAIGLATKSHKDKLQRPSRTCGTQEPNEAIEERSTPVRCTTLIPTQ